MSKQFEVFITGRAEKDLDSLPDEVADAVMDTIRGFISDPRPRGYKKIHEHRKVRLFRVVVLDDYRIVYTIEDKKLRVEIIVIGDRKDIYKRLKRRRITWKGAWQKRETPLPAPSGPLAARRPSERRMTECVNIRRLKEERNIPMSLIMPHTGRSGSP